MSSGEMVQVFYADRRKINQGRPDGWLGRVAAEDYVLTELAIWTCEKHKSIRLKRSKPRPVPPPLAASLIMAPWVVEGAADGEKRCVELAATWNGPVVTAQQKGQQGKNSHE